MWSRYVLSQVKHNAWFVSGVCLGVWAVLVCVPAAAPPGRAACGPGPARPRPPAGGLARAEDSAAPRGPAPAPSVVRPRYYHTELGVRAALLGAVLTSAPALGAGGRGSALNVTSRLPDLKLFILAAGARLEPLGAPGLVAFTDNREMLKPFHALKYLADNYLDEYNYFFLTEDSSYIDGVKLLELVKKLSVGQDVYMGIKDDNDSHYCLLGSGIIISNSVLRAVHSSLDWCVRNSYSPHHHENVGRCVLHAAHTPCTDTLQGVQYPRGPVSPPPAPSSAPYTPLSPLSPADHIHALHAHVARESLRAARFQMSVAAATAAQSAARHRAAQSGAAQSEAARHEAAQSGEWGASWPPGLRRYPTTSANRFEYVRWRHFNATHGLLWAERGAVTPLDTRHRRAVQAVLEEVKLWLSRRRGRTEEVRLESGALRFMPQAGLYYRLLVTLADSQMHMIEAVRPLGSARLVSAPYVTESARLAVLLAPASGTEVQTYRDTVRHLVTHCAGNKTSVVVLSSDMSASALWGARPPPCLSVRGSLRGSLAALRSHTVLLLTPHHSVQEDALNRVRMNCLAGVQWFLPSAWARGAVGAGGVAGGGGGAARGGRFRLSTAPTAVAATASDILQALNRNPPPASMSEIDQVAYSLSRSPLACLHAPEPGILFTPPIEPPCRRQEDAGSYRGQMETNGGDLGINEGKIGPISNIAILNNNNIDVNENTAFKDVNNNNINEKGSINTNVNGVDVKSSYKLDMECLRKLRDEDFKRLELGSRQSLATLLLERGDVDL